MTYRFAIGTDDPRALEASNDAEAVSRTVALLQQDHLDDLRRRPEAVLTLHGPNGLVSHPSERLDAFVERLARPAIPAADPRSATAGRQHHT